MEAPPSPQYIFERGQSLLVSRLFWLLIVLAAIVVGVFWSVEVSVKKLCFGAANVMTLDAPKISFCPFPIQGLPRLARQPGSDDGANHGNAHLGN